MVGIASSVWTVCPDASSFGGALPTAVLTVTAGTAFDGVVSDVAVLLGLTVLAPWSCAVAALLATVPAEVVPGGFGISAIIVLS
jgi:hypothetical protein